MTIRQIFTRRGLRWAVLENGQPIVDFLDYADAQIELSFWANF